METNNVALIIGASSGIGYNTALKLLDKGYKVYNASRGQCRDKRVVNLFMDVEKTSTVTTAVKRLYDKEGKLDVLVYCAGYSMAAPVEHAKLKDVRKLFEVNYFGAFKAVQKVIPIMREQGYGRIVLISSMAAQFPIPFDAFYSSSKAALDILAATLNAELGPYNIKVTSARPGGTRTRFSYKREIYNKDETGVYDAAMQNAVSALEKREQNGMNPKAVAESVIRIIEAKNPPEVTACGIMNKTFSLAQKILPDRLTSLINKNLYNDFSQVRSVSGILPRDCGAPDVRMEKN